MQLEELIKNIKKARSLEKPLPELPFQDFKELLEARSENSKNYLTYIDGDAKETKISYVEFYEHVLGCARFLQHHGLSRGDRIATIAHNHWHTVVQYFAAWLLGLVVVPVNLEEEDDCIAYILENGQIELAFVRTEYRSRFRNILERYDQLKHIEWIVCEGELSNFTTDRGTLDLDEDSFKDSDALVVFTSGATGKPKGVVLTQRNLLEEARIITEWHNIDQQSRMMCVLPIHHINGLVVTLLAPFWVSGSVVLNRKFIESQFFSLIREKQVHIVSVVPTLLQYVNNSYEGVENPDTSPLRHIICRATPLTIEVAEMVEERFNVPVIYGYGLSETTCYSCFVPVDISREERKSWQSDYSYPSVGVPVSANEMAIHDTAGNKLGEEERGEIVIRGVNVMREYYNNKEANEDAFKYGWFRSRDEGFYVKDEEGRPYFFITGRLKELIIRGGINLSPLEIDEVINKAPGVKAGIAVGFENDWYGEEVGAYVQLQEGVEKDEEAILAYCRTHLPFNKSPKVVVFANQIPVTSTGKYQRRKVTDQFRKWKDVQFRT